VKDPKTLVAIDADGQAIVTRDQSRYPRYLHNAYIRDETISLCSFCFLSVRKACIW